jgi:hypothetical protein
LIKLNPEFAKNYIKRYGKLSEGAVDKLHLLTSWNVEKTEKKWFSYRKCKQYLKKECQSIPEMCPKIKRTVQFLSSEGATCIGYITMSFYNFFHPRFTPDCKLSPNEKLYVQTVYLIKLLRQYMSEYQDECEFCEEGTIDWVIEKLEKVSHLCICQDIPREYVPFVITDGECY